MTNSSKNRRLSGCSFVQVVDVHGQRRGVVIEPDGDQLIADFPVLIDVNDGADALAVAVFNSIADGEFCIEHG